MKSPATRHFIVISQAMQYCFKISKNILFEFFVGVSADYVWFVTIKDFNPSKLKFFICIMITNIKIILWKPQPQHRNNNHSQLIIFCSHSSFGIHLIFFALTSVFPIGVHGLDTDITLKLNLKLIMNASRFSRFALSEQMLVLNRLKL